MDRKTRFKLRHLIAQNKPEVVIELLLNAAEETNSSDDYDSVAILSAQYNRNKESSIIGIVGHSDATLDSNKVNYNLLERIDSVSKPIISYLYNTKSTFELLFTGHDFNERNTPLARSLDERLQNYLNEQDIATKYLKILGMSKPILLQDLKVGVKFYESKPSTGLRSATEISNKYDKDDRAFYDDYRPKMIASDEIWRASEMDKTLVLGKAGIGKTTFLRTITQNILLHYKEMGIIPIYVELKHLERDSIELIDLIYRKFQDFDIHKEEVIQMFKMGKCIFLFDGLDEINMSRVDALKKGIVELSRFPTQKEVKNKFFISSRIAAYSSQFEDFGEFEIADFEDNQIRNFVHNWFDQAVIANSCYEDLKGDPAILELARVPLLLSLICIAYAEQKSIPNNKGVLYKVAIDVLLRDWDQARGVTRSNPYYKNLPESQKLGLYSTLAAKMFDYEKVFINLEELKSYLETYLPVFQKDIQNKIQQDFRGFANVLVAQHGLLMYQARQVISFAHLSFLEHFMARYLSSLPKEEIKNKILEKAFSPAWIEVINQLIGLSNDQNEVEDYIALLSKSAKKANHLSEEMTELIRGINQLSGPNQLPASVNNIFALLCYLFELQEYIEGKSYNRMLRRMRLFIKKFFNVWNLIYPGDTNADLEALSMLKADDLINVFSQQFSELNYSNTMRKAQELCEETFEDFIIESDSLHAFISTNFIQLDFMLSFQTQKEEVKQEVINELLVLD